MTSNLLSNRLIEEWESYSGLPFDKQFTYDPEGMLVCHLVGLATLLQFFWMLYEFPWLSSSSDPNVSEQIQRSELHFFRMCVGVLIWTKLMDIQLRNTL
jgi:hypothetical protein